MNSALSVKRVGSHEYFHISQINLVDQFRADQIQQAIELAEVDDHQFNVFKCSLVNDQITLLNYPDFFSEAFPQLNCYWTVDLEKQSVHFRTFEESINPPILHRKELLLSSDHESRALFSQLTATAEQIGLFADPLRIGFKLAWERLLDKTGYQVVNHQLVPIGNDELVARKDEDGDFEGVARHRTALTRYSLSAPVQSLYRFGFLDATKSFFDYGCGKGDDLRSVSKFGLNASGWDPYFNSDSELKNADIVNIGFVINVIESPLERAEALQNAYRLTDKLLVISAMLASQNSLPGKPYSDGILTSRGTFQKYFTQQSLKEYLEEILKEDAIPIGPGIFYIFKDKEEEQKFQYGRLKLRRHVSRFVSTRAPSVPRVKRDKNQEIYQANQDALNNLWNQLIELGRDPDETEIHELNSLVENFGSFKRAIKFIKNYRASDIHALENARRQRIDDLCVYMAKLIFDKNKPYKSLEPGLQRDIREFFGNYQEAKSAGFSILQTIAFPEQLFNACLTASEHGLGWLDREHALYVHTDLIAQLPALLRIYINCGLALYGDLSQVDLVKIHSRSSKLSLMEYDDFYGRALPLLTKRVKINLRSQDFDIFEYGTEFPSTYLYKKSRFINEEFSDYPLQIAVEEKLTDLGLLFDEGHGPATKIFDEMLKKKRYVLNGYSLERDPSIPDLEEKCGKYLKYRDFVECGETQKLFSIQNLPVKSESYTALFDLATNIIDPVIDYFGMIEITYGFCSSLLAKKIPARIAPDLDQHSCHEVKKNGSPICTRLGAAVDFLVKDEDMLEVAQWIATNTPFDRLYFYGNDRPIHVSFSEFPSKQITIMSISSSGRQIPKTITVEKFLTI